MDLERLRQLLDSYGADERRWPTELRTEMRAALDAHPHEKGYLLAARDLDLLLDSYQPDVDDLAGRILDAVPASPLERFLGWLLPRDPGNWWRPALAGAMPLVLGIAIGVADPGTGPSADDDSAQWEQQERALLLPVTVGVWYE